MRQSRCVRLAGAKVEREQQQQDVHYESIDGVGISASSMDGRLEGDAELGLGHGFCTLRPCKKILRVSDLAVTLPALIGASHDRGNLPDFSPVLPSIRHESNHSMAASSISLPYSPPLFATGTGTSTALLASALELGLTARQGRRIHGASFDSLIAAWYLCQNKTSPNTNTYS